MHQKKVWYAHLHSGHGLTAELIRQQGLRVTCHSKVLDDDTHARISAGWCRCQTSQPTALQWIWVLYSSLLRCVSGTKTYSSYTIPYMTVCKLKSVSQNTLGLHMTNSHSMEEEMRAAHPDAEAANASAHKGATL